MITNTGPTSLTNLYAGVFADWDVDEISSEENRAAYDSAHRLGYVYHTAPGGIYTGIQVLSTATSAYNYAFDYTSGGAGGIDITDGFTTAEKYTSLSTNRLDAGVAGNGGDVMHVLSSGPYNINAGDSIVVGFAMLAGDSLDDIQLSAQNAQEKWDTIMSAYTGVNAIEKIHQSPFLKSYPNPFGTVTTISFLTDVKANVQLFVYNALGERVVNLYTGVLAPGSHSYKVDASHLPDGMYYCSLLIDDKTYTTKMLVVK